MKRKLLSAQELYAIKMARWRCRVDLGYLCREVLGYKDVDDEIHGPVMKLLQQFPRPNREQFDDNDHWNGSTWIYKPIKPMQELPGKRRRLILDPRGHLKTTVNAQAHTIQWILNYPDLTMAIWQSNIDKAELILKEIKNHFQFNDKFRTLFPEHCPQKRILDFGTKGEFTTCARAPGVVRRESTVMTLSIDKGTAGLHFDVMKFSDVVEPENVKTKERVTAVKRSFYMAENLLVAPSYWIDVEGTRYVFNDLYGDLINGWLEEHKSNTPHEYDIHVRSCYKRLEDGAIQNRFTPDTLDDQKYPFMLNEAGEMIPWWEKDASGQPRFSFAKLELMRARDPYIFSCQQENNPKGGIDGQEIFPLSQMKWITHENFRKNVRISHFTVTIDTAETNKDRSNSSAIVVVGWDHFGRAWVVEIVHGKFLPNALIDKIFYIWRKWRPTEIKIEETSFVRGFMAGLQREMDIQGTYMPIELIKRENQTAKEERIQSTLQPWYINGLIRFLHPRVDPQDPKDLAKAQTLFPAEWAAWEALCKEMKQFPLGESDDILDALADQFQGKEWFGREIARPQITRDDTMAYYINRYYGMDPEWYDDDSTDPKAPKRPDMGGFDINGFHHLG